MDGRRAQAAATLGANDPDVPELFGSWAPVPPLPDGGGSSPAQVKLWLWSKNPFDYTRRGGRWVDRFTERFDDFPCRKPPQRTQECWGMDPLPIGASITGVPIPGLGVGLIHPSKPGLGMAWLGPDFETSNRFCPAIQIFSPPCACRHGGSTGALRGA